VPPPDTAAPRSQPSILVLDDNARVPQWFRDHFGTAYSVLGANSASAALEVFTRHDVGVVVTGETLGGESTVELLRTFKQQYPALMAIVLTTTQDADLVGRLIDDVKVCRVLFKPVKTGAVDLALKAALSLHAARRAAPLQSAGEGGAGADAPDPPANRRSLFDRVRAGLGLGRPGAES
jgi:DNA-binding NtrC family response regulator